MTFFHVPTFGRIWLVVWVFHGAASQQTAEAHPHERTPDSENLHLQIASEPPIKSAVDALDCVSDTADRTLNRNTHINSEVGGVDMADASELTIGEAEELKEEAKLHNRRAQEIESIKQTQKNRHDEAMKKIQDNDQAEVGKMEHELELIKEAESTAKSDLDEEQHLLHDIKAHAKGNKEMRLQQQKIKHKSRAEVQELMKYPLLGFSVPSALNPVEYFTGLTHGPATTELPSNSPVGFRKLRNTINRQEINDRAEILGDDAILEEVEKKKSKAKKNKKKAKAKKQKKAKKEAEEAEEAADGEPEGAGTPEPETESTPVKALHDLENAVASPFGGGAKNEEPSFDDYTIKGNSHQGAHDISVEDPYEESERHSAFVEDALDDETEADEDDEGCKKTGKDDAGRTNTFSEKSEGKGSKRDEDDDDGEDDNGKKEDTSLKEKHSKTGHKTSAKSPVEASEAETAQARALQQHQLALEQQALRDINLLELESKRRARRTNSRIKSAIDSARSRFAVAHSKTKTLNDDGEDDEAEDKLEEGEGSKEGKEANPTSEVATGQSTREVQDAALAKEEAEAAAEALAVEKEAQEAMASLEDEHKLLVAEQEATDAKNGLKSCAQGSFLNCQQAKRAKRPKHRRGPRVVR